MKPKQQQTKDSLKRYEKHLRSISTAMRRRHSDLSLKMIRSMAEVALWESLQEGVVEESIPGAICNKLKEAIRQEKGLDEKLIFNVDQPILENYADKIRGLFDCVDPDFLFESMLDLSDEEKLIGITYFGINFKTSDQLIDIFSGDLYRQFAEEINRERNESGTLDWKIRHVAQYFQNKGIRLKVHKVTKIKQKVYGILASRINSDYSTFQLRGPETYSE